MNYTHDKKIKKPFREVIDMLSNELKKDGFGVITEVDLKSKFNEKLQKDFRNYTILGACNPALAFKAVGIEPTIGVMLPCNILVQEWDNGEVQVSAINPLNSIGQVENPQLHQVAQEVDQKLKNVLSRI